MSSVRLVVERLYSLQVYPVIQRVMTSASNLTSFAWLDALLLLVTAAFLFASIRDLRRVGWTRALLRTVARLTLGLCAAAVAFIALWGLNYQRLPMTERVRFDAAAVTPASILAIAEKAVDQSNALHDGAHAAGWPEPGTVEPALARGFAQALSDLGLPATIVVGRPKATLLDWYFRRAGVSGMTDPLFLETLIATDVLPFERPFVVAHEWSHLAGLADEGDANFAGWLACLHGSVADQYSAWLFLYGESAASLRREDRAALASKLAIGPVSDLRAIRERNAIHVNPRVSAVGWRAYDSYLKANRVESGAASYAHVVRLVAGTAFTDSWRPLLR